MYDDCDHDLCRKFLNLYQQNKFFREQYFLEIQIIYSKTLILAAWKHNGQNGPLIINFIFIRKNIENWLIINNLIFLHTNVYLQV